MIKRYTPYPVLKPNWGRWSEHLHSQLDRVFYSRLYDEFIDQQMQLRDIRVFLNQDLKQ